MHLLCTGQTNQLACQCMSYTPTLYTAPCAHIFTLITITVCINMLSKYRISYPKVDVYSPIMQTWQSKCSYSYAASNTQVQILSHHT